MVSRLHVRARERYQVSLAVVLCVTPDVDRADSFVRREIAFAQLVNRPIIVARFAKVPPPISVVNNTYVDFHASGETALAQLLRFLRQRTFRKVSLPQTARNSYLAALYHEIIDRLNDAILLPVVGRRMQLLEATGMIARSKISSSGPEVLSSRYFQPARGPVAGIGIRQALDYARQRLAIVGPAGSGKTIALMVLARELASEAITDPDKPLPLLVSAASWEAGGTAEAGLISWLAREVPVLAEAIPDLIRARQVMLLVDGLDELPYMISKSEGAEQRYPRTELVRELPGACPLVVASRPHEFQAAAADLEISRVFELQPLTDAQVAEFVAQVPAAAAILNQDDALRDHFAFRYAQDAIHDPDPTIRDSAAWALWQIPDRRAVDLLLEALGDPYPYARGSAASALGRIGDPRAIGLLTKLLTDKTQVVSTYGNTIADVARWAITQIHQSE